jgi:tetratricopeptide (TPR) repeat protein
MSRPQKHTPWGRIIIAIVVSLLFAALATIGILTNLNSLFNILSLAVALLGALFAFFQWFFPFASHAAGPFSLHPLTQIPPITVHVSTPQMSPSLDTSKSVSSNRLESPTLWTVPYRRNPFFTGREALLKYLHSQLNETKAMALTQAQAINGLGGIGKTQTAVEYAYRYHDEYHSVIWIRAATRDTLITDFIELANRLQLSEKDDQDQMIVVSAVKRWLTEHQGWLLILDNADDLNVIRDFLPTGESGQILITTRAQAVGSIAYSIPIEKMDKEEGVLFLLRRATVLAAESSLDQATEVDRRQAAAIVATMDGLPLAIDQAGAYIEETRCGLASYLNLYNMHQKELLQRRSASLTDYPDSVATTWSLSFQRIEQANRAAADLLRLCSFLEPDEIPEEIFIKGAPDLGPILMPVAADELKLDQSLKEVLQYSLMKRNEKAKMLSIHRLVQAVLNAGMSQKTQRLWAERAVRGVARTLPDIEEETLVLGQRLLPHTQICALLIDHYGFAFPEAAQLLMWTGSYLIAHAEYIQEELLSQRSLMVQEQLLGTAHSNASTSLTRIDSFSVYQVRDKEAEPLYRQALAIREQVLGLEHPTTALTLYTLAQILRRQDKKKEAEPLYLRALAIYEREFGPEYVNTAQVLHGLGLLYWEQGRYKEAESLLQHVLAIREQTFGTEHIGITNILLHLGGLYSNLDKYKDAEALYLRALTICKQEFGPDDVNTAIVLRRLGLLYHDQRKFEEAKSQFKLALAIYEKVLGSPHPDTAFILIDLGWLNSDQGRFQEAEYQLKRAQVFLERVLGLEHPDTANCYQNLGRFLRKRNRLAQAEKLYRRALAIYEKILGPEHSATASICVDLGRLYQGQERYQEAEQFLKRALAIREKMLGPEHPRTTDSLCDLGWLYRLQRRYQEGVLLYQHALAIRVKVWGPEHPIIADTLVDLGFLYDDQGKYQEAEPLFHQALSICEPIMAPANNIGVIVLSNYFSHLLRTRRIMKALPYGVRVLKILGLREAFHRGLSGLKPYVRRYILKR